MKRSVADRIKRITTLSILVLGIWAYLIGFMVVAAQVRTANGHPVIALAWPIVVPAELLIIDLNLGFFRGPPTPRCK